jgi:hypothetical protein
MKSEYRMVTPEDSMDSSTPYCSSRAAISPVTLVFGSLMSMRSHYIRCVTAGA